MRSSFDLVTLWCLRNVEFSFVFHKERKVIQKSYKFFDLRKEDQNVQSVLQEQTSIFTLQERSENLHYVEIPHCHTVGVFKNVIKTY